MPKKYYGKKKKGFGSGGGHANMPQDVVMSYYPKGPGYMKEGLDDGLSGIDSQRSSDVSGLKKNKSKSKY